MTFGTKATIRSPREILDPDFRIRGSLGPERVGLAGFRTALADYQCIIDDLIETDTRVAARMRFQGIHSGQFFGKVPTGREITWSGAAFFTMDRGRITELWVLGDIDAVKQQLGAGLGSSFAGQNSRRDHPIPTCP